jgi:hypothetical protein
VPTPETQILIEVGCAAASGEWLIHDDEAAEVVEHELPRLECGVVAADSLEPIASSGHIALFSPAGRVEDGDLALLRQGGSQYLRRVFRAELGGVGDSGWVGQVVNPRVRNLAPVVLRADDTYARRLVGVLYSRDAAGQVQLAPSGAELVGLGRFPPNRVGGLLAQARAVRVVGNSAEPVALGGQCILVTGAATDAVRDGALVVAVLSSGESVLKRFRRSRREAILFPVDTEGDHDILRATLAASHSPEEDGSDGLPTLDRLWLVIGVLFVPPESLAE